MDIEITGRLLVAIGAALAGVGSLLSGYAALRAARKEGREELMKEKIAT